MKQDQAVKVPPRCQPILDHWDKECCFKVPGLHTKSIKNVLLMIKKAMNGSLFKKNPYYAKYDGRKFTKEEIMRSMTEFSLAAFDAAYHPDEQKFKEKFQKTSLTHFFYNPYTQKSHFINFLEQPAIRINEVVVLVDDEYPACTNHLKSWFQRTCCAGVKQTYDKHQENCFRTASIKLHKFFEQNRGKVIYPDQFLQELPTLLCEAIETNKNGKFRVTPGWFSSDRTFEQRLPSYLDAQGYFEASNYDENRARGSSVEDCIDL